MSSKESFVILNKSIDCGCITTMNNYTGFSPRAWPKMCTYLPRNEKFGSINVYLSLWSLFMSLWLVVIGTKINSDTACMHILPKMTILGGCIHIYPNKSEFWGSTPIFHTEHDLIDKSVIGNWHLVEVFFFAPCSKI